MGSLEPIDTKTSRLLTYKNEECHGALVKLSPTNYEKLMRSEGVGNGNSTDESYEEIVVQAYPYGDSKNNVRPRRGKPILAVALRARPHVRLNFDPCPSARYMKLLTEGARELNLEPCYQDFLARIPVGQLSPWRKKQAFYNLVFTLCLSIKLNWRGYSKLQSRLLYFVYAPYSARTTAKIISALMTTIILIPGAVIGFFLFHILELTGKTPPALTRMMTFIG